MRFITPGPGAQGRVRKGEWQLGIAYRRLTADQWFVGRQLREDKAPFGQPLLLNINSVDVSVDYGVSDRTRVTLTLPFSHGTHSRLYADGVRHKVSASGLGDISAIASRWVTRNFELGIGVKSATGRNDVRSDYYLPAGTTTFFVDQSIQLGDGGWGVILQGRAFREVFRNASVYVTGSYLVSPRNQTGVIQGQSGPYSRVRVSVPDVYDARTGVSYNFSDFAFSVAGRMDGIPRRDLIGKSDGFRRPAIIGYIEPAVSATRGRETVSFSVPVRAYANFRPSAIDRQLGSTGGGDLAKTLFFANYQHRF